MSLSQQPTVLFSPYQNNTWTIRQLVQETQRIILKIVGFLNIPIIYQPKLKNPYMEQNCLQALGLINPKFSLVYDCITAQPPAVYLLLYFFSSNIAGYKNWTRLLHQKKSANIAVILITRLYIAYGYVLYLAYLLV